MMNEVCRNCRHFIAAASEEDVRRSRSWANRPQIGAHMCAFSGNRIYRPDEHTVCVAPNKWTQRRSSK